MVKYNASNGGALRGLLRPYCVGLVPGRWAKRLLLEAGRWEAEGRASGSTKAEDRGAIWGGHAIAPGRQRGSAQVGVGNSVKAIREPGLFRWSGSAVRCPGGQAVFDGAVFTAKGEG